MASGLASRPAGDVLFGPFRLDVAGGCLWRGEELVRLRPKVWELLCALVANPGRLLTKEDLMELVWEGNVVGDTLPNVSITELRRALGDDPKSPSYVQTVHGRGFRFVAAIVGAERTEKLAAQAPPQVPGPSLVGRQREIEILAPVLAADSDCRVGFISGEAGIGKTSLLNALLARGVSSPGVVARGQCLAHFGKSYPHLALLGALEDMCRRHPHVLPLLRAVAPMWLRRLPGRFSVEEAEATGSPGEEGSASAAIDELLALQEALGQVVWAIEDLHWADHATIEVLSVLIERSPRSTCCVVATYRLAEAIVTSHPLVRLRRELRRRLRCREVVLEGLDGAGVFEYLTRRLPALRLPGWLPERLLARTGGNPFFLAATVDHLIDAGRLDPVDSDTPIDWDRLSALTDEVPPTLRDTLREQISETSAAERRLLEAASVGGLEVDAATVAAALAESVVTVDAACTALSRHSPMLQRIGESAWPDGTASGRYQFRHALYQDVLYEDQSLAARREAHTRIARALAAGFGGSAGAAPIIADHFARGGERDSAIEYYLRAARAATERQAAHEAVLHLRQALALHDSDAAAPPERAGAILTKLGKALTAIEGFRGEGVEEVFLRAQRLSAEGKDARREITALVGLAVSNLMQGRPDAAEEMTTELLALTESRPESRGRRTVEIVAAAVLYHRGDLTRALTYVENALAAQPATSSAAQGPLDSPVAATALGSIILWQVGRPDAALAAADRARELVRDGFPFNRIVALQAAVAVHQWRGEHEEVFGATTELSAVRQQDFPEAEGFCLLTEAWARLQRGELVEARALVDSGVDSLRRNGSMTNYVYLLAVAAEANIGLGRHDVAAQCLTEAWDHIAGGGARYWEPEIHRLQGELHALAGGRRGKSAANDSFDASLHIAEQQGSYSLILRTATSHARLAPKSDAAASRLAAALANIQGGANTKDIRAARALLATPKVKAPLSS